MYRVDYCVTGGGKCPVERFIDGLREKTRAKVFSEVAMLSEFGPVVGMPYARQLEEGIFELRVSQGKDEVRIMYFFAPSQRIVLTHGFLKKTEKTPSREIRRAKRMRDEWRRNNG